MSAFLICLCFGLLLLDPTGVRAQQADKAAAPAAAAPEKVAPASKAAADKPSPAKTSSDKPAPDKAAAPDKTPPAAPEKEAPKDWQVVLSMHQESLVQQAARFKSMEELLPKNVRRFRQDLAAQEKKLDELGLIISLSGGNPWELQAVLNDMARVRRSTKALIGPFQDGRDDLEKIASRLDSLKEEFAKRLEDEPEADIAAAIQYYMRYTTGVKKSLVSVRSTLDKELDPARDLLESLSAAEKNLQERIPKAWKTYYFTPAGGFFSLEAWLESAKRMELWAKTNLTMVRSLTLGADAKGATSVFSKVLIGFCLLFVLDFVAWRRLRTWLSQVPGVRQLRRAGRLVVMGLIFHWVSQGAPLLLHELLNGLAEILLAAAFAVFSWFLVRTSGIVAEAKVRNPLRSLWGIFALGLVLQIVDIPEPALTGVWLVLLLFFFRISRRAAGHAPGPLRVPGRMTPVLAVGFMLVTLLGWQHLSVLLLAGWFLILTAIQAGVGLSRLETDWEARAATAGVPMVTRSLVSGLGFPLIFLSLFFLVLYWFSSELGGPGMFWTTISFTVAVGDLSVTLGSLALILTGFFLTRSALFAVRSLIRDLPKLRPGIDLGVRDVLDTTSRYVFWGAYALISLFLLGFSFTSLAVIAGGLSVGIGFGLQNIVNNFVAGLILLFGRSIQAGDTIQIDSIWGVVRKVNIRNTMVRTFDNATLFVPNSDLIAGKLINWSHRDPTVRREITVGVAYGSDTGQVRDILLAAAKAHPRVLAHPEPAVQFQNFGESSLDFKLFFWVDNVSVGLSTMSDIRFELDRRFREAGIEIPFPQREVRIVGGCDPHAQEAAAIGGAD